MFIVINISLFANIYKIQRNNWIVVTTSGNPNTNANTNLQLIMTVPCLEMRRNRKLFKHQGKINISLNFTNPIFCGTLYLNFR